MAHPGKAPRLASSLGVGAARLEPGAPSRITIKRRITHDLEGDATAADADDPEPVPRIVGREGPMSARFWTPGKETPNDEDNWLLYNEYELAMVFPVATLRGLLANARFVDHDGSLDALAPDDAIATIQGLSIPKKPHGRRGREFGWSWTVDIPGQPLYERSMIAFALQSKSDLARALFRLSIYDDSEDHRNFVKRRFGHVLGLHKDKGKAIDHAWTTLVQVGQNIPDLFALGARAFFIATEYTRMKKKRLYCWLLFYYPLGATDSVIAFKVSPVIITDKDAIPPVVVRGDIRTEYAKRWAHDLARDVQHASQAWQRFIRESMGYDPMVDDVITEAAGFTKTVAGHFNPVVDVVYVQFRKLEQAPAPYENDNTVRLALTVADRTHDEYPCVKYGSMGDFYLRFRITGDNGRTKPQTVAVEEGKVGDTPRSITYGETTTYEIRSPREFLTLLDFIESKWRDLGPSVRDAARAMKAVLNTNPHTDLYRKGLRVVASLKYWTLFIRLAIMGPNGEHTIGVWGDQNKLAVVINLGEDTEAALLDMEYVDSMAVRQARGLEQVFAEAERTVKLVDRLKEEVKRDTYRGLSKSPTPLDILPRVNSFLVGK